MVNVYEPMHYYEEIVFCLELQQWLLTILPDDI